METGYILRRAWRITWQHKLLWVFGCLVSLGMVSTRLGVSGSQWELAVQELPLEIQQPIVEFLDGPHFATVTVALAVVGFIVGVGLSLVSALGRVGLVHQTRAAEEYGAIVLKGGWLAGKRHLWQVFFARLLLGLPVGAVLLIGALPAIAARLLIAGQERPEGWMFDALVELLRFTCLAPAACLSLLLSIPVGVLQRLAVRACVLEKLGARESIARAWEMLRENLGELALVWVILLGIGIVAVAAVVFPLALLWVLLWAIAQLTVFVSPLLSLALTLIVGLLVWLAAVTIGGVAETFTSAIWTLAYRELTGMGLTGEEIALAV
jgi:hypothetical protein